MKQRQKYLFSNSFQTGKYNTVTNSLPKKKLCHDNSVTRNVITFHDFAFCYMHGYALASSNDLFRFGIANNQIYLKKSLDKKERRGISHTMKLAIYRVR